MLYEVITASNVDVVLLQEIKQTERARRALEELCAATSANFFRLFSLVV